MAEEVLQLRLYGESSLPTLIYLPGLHGDWTLITSFRLALAGRVRFVEMTYPRTLEWSLGEYAAAVETKLAEFGIRKGWLLGESFGSQLVWPLLSRNQLAVEGVVLAGGFGRHPMNWGVRVAECCFRKMSPATLTRICLCYAKIARWRFRCSPDVVHGINDFVARRTELDKEAARHRLNLIARHDPCQSAAQVQVPLYGLTGLVDPIVPWMLVRPWLRDNCPALREYKVIWRADHNVLGTAPRASADQIVSWIQRHN